MSDVKFIFAVTNVVISLLVAVALIADFISSYKLKKENKYFSDYRDELIRKSCDSSKNPCNICQKRNDFSYITSCANRKHISKKSKKKIKKIRNKKQWKKFK